MKRPVNSKVGYKFGAKPYPLAVYNPDGSWFGWIHHGNDYPVKSGTKVVAPEAGTVTHAGWAGTAGIMVVIELKGKRHRLLHNSKVYVKAGQKVKEGQLVALSGATGFAFGAHCHHDFALNGKYVNAEKYITATTAVKVYHTVKSGDTVGAICLKYGISIATFKKLNPTVTNINVISVGQKLRVK
jgi:murein DD-endopeptidase MepM/ murein hydrolase activator NlpD